jgi:hypothetical protein
MGVVDDANRLPGWLLLPVQTTRVVGIVAVGHVIKDRKKELAIGLILWVFASYLLYDAWARRGKNAPWPLGAVMPF